MPGKKKLLLFLLLIVSTGTAVAKPEFPPECPRKGTGESVADPAAWADNCFMAYTGRKPYPDQYETQTQYRDIDLDGKDERLEVRGSGQKIKQIYVFSVENDLFKYKGQLNAYPKFDVITGSDEKPNIMFIYRQGFDALFMVQIKYINNEFKVVERTKIK